MSFGYVLMLCLPNAIPLNAVWDVSQDILRLPSANNTRISLSESSLKSDPIVTFARAKPQSLAAACPSLPLSLPIHSINPSHLSSTTHLKAYIVWPYPIYDASSPLLEHPSKNEPYLEKPFFDSSSF